jgi:hypothetical protein
MTSSQTDSACQCLPQDNAEPLLRLAHKYELRAVTCACDTVMAVHINKATYASLPEEQLQQLLHWLDVAVELGLAQLRTSVLECLRDCTLKAVFGLWSASTLSVSCRRCTSVFGPMRMVDATSGRCSNCGTTGISVRPELKLFRQVWARGAEGTGSQQAAAQEAALEAALGGMQAGELRPLLKALMLPAFNRVV